MKRIFGYVGMALFLFSGSVVHSAQTVHNPFEEKGQVEIYSVVGIPVGIPLQQYGENFHNLSIDEVIVAVGINTSTDRENDRTALFCFGQCLAEGQEGVGVHKIHVAYSQGIVSKINSKLADYNKFMRELPCLLATNPKKCKEEIEEKMREYSKYILINQWTQDNDGIQEDLSLREKYHKGELKRSDVEDRKKAIMGVSGSFSRSLQKNLGIYKDLLDIFQDESDWDSYLIIQRDIQVILCTHYDIVPSTIIKLTASEYSQMHERVVKFSGNQCDELCYAVKTYGKSYSDVLDVLLDEIVDKDRIQHVKDYVYSYSTDCLSTCRASEQLTPIADNSAHFCVTRLWRNES